jgi:peptidoglycan hydrolase-like protein with peptidoglycan-binding domain
VPAIAASSVLGVVLIAAISSAGRGSDGSTDIIEAGGQVDVTLTVPPSSQGIVVDSAANVQKSQLAAPITIGSSGDDVKQVQQRLTELGFAPGPVDGQFGAGTQQAVWAYKKLIMQVPAADLRASDTASQVTDEMWQQMQDPITIPPRRSQGYEGSRHLEVYLPEQVAIIFHGDTPELITHISTGELNPDGTPATFCETVTIDTDANGNPLEEPQEKAICAESKTPGGVFEFYRRYEGNRQGPLGGMFNPVYFNYGIAIHGAQNVPLYPASHGCVRVNNAIAEFLPDLVSNGDRVYVWGHDGKQPEQYSKNEMLPSFNRPDPDATTTTTSTTTSTTTTLVPATTTTRPAPATTTTSAPPPATTTTTTTTTTAVPAP